MFAQKKTKLPYVKLATEAHVACRSKTWRELDTRLKSEAPNEGCTFALTWPSIGQTRATTLLGELLWPQPGEVTATPHSLEISSDYISRVLDAAIDAGPLCGIALVHTHPDTEYGRGVGVFSARDDWYEQRLFPTFTNAKRQAVHCSIVLGPESSSVDARIWWASKHGPGVQRVGVVRVVGPELGLLETASSNWLDHPDPSLMDRSTRLWGAQGRRRLQNIHVGIVGVGGTGSVAVVSLATMGVGKISTWDKDIVKKENLHRMLGVARRYVGKRKVEAFRRVATDLATANPFRFIGHEDWGTTSDSIRELKDCDIIFSCVDKLAARVPLNDLAYAHLIPTLDVASWIHATEGSVDSISTHAHVLSPGIPCAWCRQTLTSFALMREAQGAQREIERRAPYGLTSEETDGVEPSVLALNMTGVSLALMQFMQVALGITKRTPRDLKFFLPEWELDESDLNSASACTSESNAGLGDSVTIAPVEPPDA
jgi:molybdopterin-synthase adenylyltransferase